MLTNLKKNDKVITTAGIYGTVISVAEKEDEVVVKVDDNTRLKMLKGAIMRNITNEEDAAKAQQAKAEDRVAARYFAEMKAKGKAVPPPQALPAPAGPPAAPVKSAAPASRAKK